MKKCAICMLALMLCFTLGCSAKTIEQNIVVDPIKTAEIGFALDLEEIDYLLKDNRSDTGVIELFGEPESKSEAIEWGADGLIHQSWLYTTRGLEFDRIKNDDDTWSVISIKMNSPCKLKTSRGIGIGSSRADVLKAYEYEIDIAENPAGTDAIVAGTVYGGVLFDFEEDRVSRIFIGAAAE